MGEIFNKLLFGERLRACRIARQQTMKEFAEVCKLSERYLSDIEHGIKAPKSETLIRIANNVGVSLEYLLQDSLTMDKGPGLRIQNALYVLSAEQQKLIENFIIKLTETLR